jgi:ABC-type bacteriocin/lantibiotic exporter with double-glycine peptidase domain
MVLKDLGVEVPEMYLREALNVDAEKGGLLKEAPKGIADFGKTATYAESMSMEELAHQTQGGAVVVSVSKKGYGAHALVVDGVTDEHVLIRDPLPEGQGSSYKIRKSSFMGMWAGKALMIR